MTELRWSHPRFYAFLRLVARLMIGFFIAAALRAFGVPDWAIIVGALGVILWTYTP